MALANFSAYKSKTESPDQSYPYNKATFIGTGVNWSSAWIGNGFFGRGTEAGAIPTSSAATDRSTAGAIAQTNPSVADSLRVWLKSSVTGVNSTAAPMAIMLVDRLVHSGGLSGIVTGAQSTNLPTAALTRYTTGVGVMAALEIYTAVGTSASTITVTYTDDAGNTGQVSPAFNFGASPWREQQRFLPVPLLQGDKGVRAVASVNLAGSTTTAGNFGVTLYKPLLVTPIRVWADYVNTGDPLRTLGGLLPQVINDACLHFVVLSGGQVTGAVSGEICFMEV